MGMPFSIGRTLFAQMPPSIVINEPLPRWKVIAWSGFRVAVVVMLCTVLFYAGILFERHRPKAVAQAELARSGPAPTKLEAPQDPGASAVAAPDPMAPIKLDGLDILALTVVRDSDVPGQLRYEFAVSNEGRLYEGAQEFLIRGTQDGRPTVWEYPSAGQRTGGRFQMRVGRYIKTEGKIQLPAGLVPEAVTLRLRESSGSIRASRGAKVPAAEQN